MNRENIQKVRDHIAALDAGRFNMTDYFVLPADEGRDRYTDAARRQYGSNAAALEGSCGTAACIAGHALALLLPEQPIPDKPKEVAADLFDIGDDEANELFVPDARTNSRTTPAQAVRVLDHLLETGLVDWSIIDVPTPDLTEGEGA